MVPDTQPDSSHAEPKPANSGGDFARTRRRERAPASAVREAGGSFLFGNDPANHLISAEWPRMAMAMALALALLALVNFAIPPALPSAIALVAVCLTLTGLIATRIESNGSLGSGQRVAILGIVVALPMFLFGSAMGLYATAGTFAWFQCIAAVATVALVATIVQSGRLLGVLAAQVSAWAGFTCVASTLGGYLALGLGFAIAGISYRRQSRIDAVAREKLEKDQRAQTRAQEILADYEKRGRAGSGKPIAGEI